MQCERVQEQLNTLCDGERLDGWGRYLEVGTHCLGCAACRVTWRQLRQIRRLALCLPVSPPSPQLKARLMDSLPLTPPLPARALPRARRDVRRRLLGGVAVTAALAATLLILPRGSGNSSLAAEVGTALKGVHGWHLRGWKLVDGKQVPWEVWGQRAPFFYREQVGDWVMLDNGVMRAEVFPPLPGKHRTRGVVMQVPSKTKDSNWTALFATHEWRNEAEPARQTETEAVFHFRHTDFAGPGTTSEHIYVVDKQAKLPTQYELRKTEGRRERVVESAQIDYGAPLPVSALSVPRPPGYLFADGTKSVRVTPNAPGPENKDRMTVQLIPLQMDVQGHVLVRVHGWLGQITLDSQPSLEMQAAPGPSRYASTATCYDEEGRIYLPVTNGVVGWQTSADYSLVLAPLEPLSSGDTPPHSLTAAFAASLYVVPRHGTSVGNGCMLLDDVSPFSQGVTAQVTLPQQTAALDIAAFLPPGRKLNQWVQLGPKIKTIGNQSLEAACDYARYQYYYFGSNGSKDRAGLLQAAHWLEKAIAIADPLWVPQYRVELADCYRLLGDVSRARRVLQKVLTESKHGPANVESYRQQAALELHALASPSN